MRRFLAALALFLALPAPAQTELEQARQTIVALEGLLKQRPEDPTLWFYLSRFQAQAGNRPASVAAMEKVLALGEGFLPPREFGFESVWGDPDFKAIVGKLEARLPRLDFAPTAFELEERELIPEGIAWDPGSSTLFVGSIAQRKILRVEPGGRVSALAGPEAGLDHVLGLTVDSPRRILHAVSTSALTEEGEKNRRNAIVSFDIDTGRLIRRVDVPGASQLNDVEIGRAHV